MEKVMEIIVNNSTPYVQKGNFAAGDRVKMFGSGGRKRNENGDFFHYFNCRGCQSSYSMNEDDFLSDNVNDHFEDGCLKCPVCSHKVMFFISYTKWESLKDNDSVTKGELKMYEIVQKEREKRKRHLDEGKIKVENFWV
jgi:hypothetical protein